MLILNVETVKAVERTRDHQDVLAVFVLVQASSPACTVQIVLSELSAKALRDGLVGAIGPN